MSAEVYLGLGGNLGDPPATFRKALELLTAFSKVLKVSKLYRSKPYGFSKQPDFYNAAARISTDLEPLDLLVRLQEIEQKLGKKVIRENGPRIIDLDLLLYGDETLNLPELHLPHPGILQRDFVLRPLHDLNPALSHPSWQKKTLETALADLGQSYLLEDSKLLEDPNL
ncbi:2-amino-4-hydroxy-6-hydroxymethyldihydropteridine diphosphokinase [Opitutales bacterium]|nr:2-amino-4-hydroxy-6-hydroxymethyldihydropteridine diphosphokinase [Opitutales bacterium]